MTKEELLQKFLTDNDFVYNEHESSYEIDLNDTEKLFIQGSSLDNISIGIEVNYGHGDCEYIHLVDGKVSLQLIVLIIRYHCPKRLVIS